MSKKTLSSIRAIIRQHLRDEFSGNDFKWEDDELDIYISHTLGEISEREPYVVKETLKTTADSKELDISSIEDLVKGVKSIVELEYPTGSDPRDFRNVIVIDASTIEIDTTLTPAADEDVYLYCNKLHQLTEESSTLPPQLERLLVDGVVASAAISKAQSHIGIVNIGGGRTPSELLRWGEKRWDKYESALSRLPTPSTYTEYPKG